MFEGMNTEEGREVAQEIITAGQEVLDLINGVTSRVNGVEWVGPDYDSFQEDWNQFVNGAVNGLVEAFQAKGKDLDNQAQQQDTGSSAK